MQEGKDLEEMGKFFFFNTSTVWFGKGVGEVPGKRGLMDSEFSTSRPSGTSCHQYPEAPCEPGNPPSTSALYPAVGGTAPPLGAPFLQGSSPLGTWRAALSVVTEVTFWHLWVSLRLPLTPAVSVGNTF